MPTLRVSDCVAAVPPISELPFPLQEGTSRVRKYYFARNGVWEAARLAGLKAGDEVLMPYYTSGIEVEALEQWGAIPVFYHITNNLEPDFDDVKNKITTRTRMFYLIHYFGFAQPLDQVRELCHRYGLILFEDNALGYLSADQHARPLGSTGDFGLLCPRKTLPLPHGGLMVINNEKYIPATYPPQRHPSYYSTLGETWSLLLRARIARGGVGGATAAAFKNHFIPAGKKIFARMGATHTESGGAEFSKEKTDWGMSPLSEHLLYRYNAREIIRIRREHYQMLTNEFRKTKSLSIELLFPDLPPHACPLEYMIIVRDIRALTQALRDARVEGGLHWWWQKPQQIGGNDEVAKKLLTRGILLPIHQNLTTDDIKRIAEVIRDAVR